MRLREALRLRGVFVRAVAGVRGSAEAADGFVVRPRLAAVPAGRVEEEGDGEAEAPPTPPAGAASATAAVAVVGVAPGTSGGADPGVGFAAGCGA